MPSASPGAAVWIALQLVAGMHIAAPVESEQMFGALQPDWLFERTNRRARVLVTGALLPACRYDGMPFGPNAAFVPIGPHHEPPSSMSSRPLAVPSARPLKTPLSPWRPAGMSVVTLTTPRVPSVHTIGLPFCVHIAEEAM